MLLKIEDAAKFFRVKPKTVRGYIRDGRLDAMKFGRDYRLTQTALDKFMNENETSKNRQLGRDICGI
jgi:excisionase family DNA binding protein